MLGTELRSSTRAVEQCTFRTISSASLESLALGTEKKSRTRQHEREVGRYRSKTHVLRERKHLGNNDTSESMSLSKRIGLRHYSYTQDFGGDIAQLIELFVCPA